MRLLGALPKHHGLTVVADDLVNHPHGKHIVIAVVDCAKVVMDTDSDEYDSVIRVRRVEVIRSEADQSTAAALLQAAADARKNADALPFEDYVLEGEA